MYTHAEIQNIISAHKGRLPCCMNTKSEMIAGKSMPPNCHALGFRIVLMFMRLEFLVMYYKQFI